MIEESTLVERISLSQGESHCSLLARLGGSIGAWSVGGQEMLRPATAAGISNRDPYATAGFPLVPFSNRVGGARFEWQGRMVSLMRNFPPEPHAIHGVGFERPWQVQARSANSMLLVLKHQPDDAWPWGFEARQRITVGDDSLVLDLSATNLESSPVPLAIGHHPYIPRAGAQLTFYAGGVWQSGKDGLPGDQVAPSGNFDFSKGASIERADIDHCFCGWGRAAYVKWQDKPLLLEITASSELPCVVVYGNAELNEFCFEPVAHINDALNRREAELSMPVVRPGENFSANVRFRAIRR